MLINKHHIPPKAAELLDKLSGLKFMSQYTLVGGTALALQIGHRQSEDLDFIYDGEKMPATTLKRQIARHFPKYRLIREEKDYQLDYLIGEVKLTFFSTGAVLLPFDVKSYAVKVHQMNIAPVDIIAVLKMATLAQRNTIRDYYDLYFIAKYHIPLSQIIEKSKVMLPNISPITYTETIIYTADILEDTIENHLNPKEIVTKEQLSDFFISELKKYGK